MGRFCYGPSLYGPSWLWAEFVMGRVCYGPRCPVTDQTGYSRNGLWSSRSKTSRRRCRSSEWGKRQWASTEASYPRCLQGFCCHNKIARPIILFIILLVRIGLLSSQLWGNSCPLGWSFVLIVICIYLSISLSIFDPKPSYEYCLMWCGHGVLVRKIKSNEE